MIRLLNISWKSFSLRKPIPGPSVPGSWIIKCVSTSDNPRGRHFEELDLADEAKIGIRRGETKREEKETSDPKRSCSRSCCQDCQIDRVFDVMTSTRMSFCFKSFGILGLCDVFCETKEETCDTCLRTRKCKYLKKKSEYKKIRVQQKKIRVYTKKIRVYTRIRVQFSTLIITPTRFVENSGEVVDSF